MERGLGSRTAIAQVAAGPRGAELHRLGDRCLRDRTAALAGAEHRQHALLDPRTPAAADERRAGRDRRTDLRRTGAAVALPAQGARAGDRKHRARTPQGDRLRRAVQRAQRLPPFCKGLPTSARPVRPGARRRNRAVGSAEQRRRAHRDGHDRNHGERGCQVPWRQGKRAAARSRVAARQRAAAPRSGQCAATRSTSPWTS